MLRIITFFILVLGVSVGCSQPDSFYCKTDDDCIASRRCWGDLCVNRGAELPETPKLLDASAPRDQPPAATPDKSEAIIFVGSSCKSDSDCMSHQFCYIAASERYCSVNCALGCPPNFSCNSSRTACIRDTAAGGCKIEEWENAYDCRRVCNYANCEEDCDKKFLSQTCQICQSVITLCAYDKKCDATKDPLCCPKEQKECFGPSACLLSEVASALQCASQCGQDDSCKLRCAVMNQSAACYDCIKKWGECRERQQCGSSVTRSCCYQEYIACVGVFAASFPP